MGTPTKTYHAGTVITITPQTLVPLPGSFPIVSSFSVGAVDFLTDRIEASVNNELTQFSMTICVYEEKEELKRML
jgi:hypothetical protein